MPITKTNKSKNGKTGYRVRINYTDRDGNPHQVERTAYGSTEAKMLEAKLQEEYSGKTVDIDSRMTVSELYERFVESRRFSVRVSSQEKTSYIFKLYILPVLGDIRLDRLNVKTLQKWKNTVAERGIAVSTQKNIYAELRTMLNFAVRMEFMDKNPLTVVGNFKDTDFTPAKDKLHYYTPEEFKRYIAVAKQDAQTTDSLTDWGYYVFFCIAYYTGARKGEINALKWSDLDGNIMHIRRSITQRIKGESVVETPPKNKTSYRDIEMPVPLISVLEEHKNRQKQKLSRFSEDLRVCAGTSFLRDSSLSNRNAQFAKEAGLPRIRIHDFRHSHVSLLANAGINIQEISRRLGHAKIEMTWNTYSHMYPKESERALIVLNEIKI